MKHAISRLSKAHGAAKAGNARQAMHHIGHAMVALRKHAAGGSSFGPQLPADAQEEVDEQQDEGATPATNASSAPPMSAMLSRLSQMRLK